MFLFLLVNRIMQIFRNNYDNALDLTLQNPGRYSSPLFVTYNILEDHEFWFLRYCS